VSSHYERTIKLRVFEERVMKIVFEPERKGAKRGSRKMQMMNFVLGPYHHVSSGFSNEVRCDGRGV
jgi:hypothetical protein